MWLSFFNTFWKILIIVLLNAICLLGVTALVKKGSSIYRNEPEQKNPMEGKRVVFVEDENDPENADGSCGHLEAIGES